MNNKEHFGSNMKKWDIKSNRSYPMYDVFSFIVSNFIEALKYRNTARNENALRFLSKMFHFFSEIPLFDYVAAAESYAEAISLPYSKELAQYTYRDFVRFIEENISQSRYIINVDRNTLHKRSISVDPDIVGNSEAEVFDALNREEHMGVKKTTHGGITRNEPVHKPLKVKRQEGGHNSLVSKIRLDSVFTFEWLRNVGDRGLTVSDRQALIDFYVENSEGVVGKMYTDFRKNISNMESTANVLKNKIKKGQIDSVELYQDVLADLVSMKSLYNEIERGIDLVNGMYKYANEPISKMAETLELLAIYMQNKVLIPLTVYVYDELYEKHFYPESNEIYYILGMFEEEPKRLKIKYPIVDMARDIAKDPEKMEL
jgi:hypothetical protein